MTDSAIATPEFALPKLPDLRETKVFGRTICYYDLGQGPPLVLVHGCGGDADQWAFCFEGLTASNRVIAIDLLGFGRSDKPLIDYRIAGYVEMLDRFLTGIGIDNAAILGHSLGGWIAAAFTLRFPQRVTKLVLVDSAGIESGSIGIPIDLNISSRANMRETFEAMFYDKRMVQDALVDLAYSLHLERNDGYTIKSVLETLTSPAEKIDGRLGDIKRPTLVVWGEDDAITPMSMARAFNRGIAGSQLHAIAKCGHFPPLEKVPEFVQAVSRFLAPA